MDSPTRRLSLPAGWLAHSTYVASAQLAFIRKRLSFQLTVDYCRSQADCNHWRPHSQRRKVLEYFSKGSVLSAPVNLCFWCSAVSTWKLLHVYGYYQTSWPFKDFRLAWTYRAHDLLWSTDVVPNLKSSSLCVIALLTLRQICRIPGLLHSVSGTTRFEIWGFGNSLRDYASQLSSLRAALFIDFGAI